MEGGSLSGEPERKTTIDILREMQKCPASGYISP
jgi:hypothetical protein